jgi:hypothetical protein
VGAGGSAKRLVNQINADELSQHIQLKTTYFNAPEVLVFDVYGIEL